MRRFRRFLPLLLPLGFSGCSAVGGLTGMVMPLLNMAIYLAAAVAPFALAYYMYKKDE